MVWGLKFPASFGQFFPDGDFIGWEEALTAHFKDSLTKSEREKHNNSDTDYRFSVSLKFIKDLGPIEQHEWPSEYRIIRLPKELGAILSVTNQFLIVADRFKTIVEELERGVHKFNPIKITLKNGQPVSGSYHVMVIGQYLDVLEPDASDEGSLRKGKRFYSAYLPYKEYYAGISLSEQKTKNKHLWRVTNLYDPELFFSDELHSRLGSSDLLLPKMHQLKDASNAKPKRKPETLAPWGSKEWVDFHFRTPGAIVPNSVPDGSVWAVFKPAGMANGFFPSVGFVGWVEELENHVKKEKISSPLRQPEHIEAIVSRIAQKFEQGLAPLQPHEKPDTFFTRDEMERYPSLIRLNAGVFKVGETKLLSPQYLRPLVVDAELKDIIEALEPGTHQFWPIKILMSPDKKEHPRPMFGMSIGKHLDAFKPDQCRPGAYREIDNRFYAKSDSRNAVSGLAVSSLDIGSTHLWREKKLAYPSVFMSSTLMSEIEKRRLLMPKTFKMKVF